jgi:hypothetical protein
MSDEALWDVLDEYEAAETGGGGLIGKIRFEIGFKAFVSGVGNEESFFTFKAGNDKSKGAAKKKCDALISEHGADGRPQVCIQFRVYKDDVIGREVTWQGDRFFCHPLWTQGYKEVVKPALKECGAELGELWGRIGFTADPSGRMTENQQGETVPEMIEHLVEVYKDQAEAESAAVDFAASGDGGNGSSSSKIVVPEGYTTETWVSVKPEILEALGDNPSGGDIAKVAADYGATVPAVKSLLD